MNYIYSNNCSPFRQFESNLKLFYTFNKKIVSKESFKARASVVSLVGMTRSCERSSAIMLCITATEIIAHHSSVLLI